MNSIVSSYIKSKTIKSKKPPINASTHIYYVKQIIIAEGFKYLIDSDNFHSIITVKKGNLKQVLYAVARHEMIRNIKNKSKAELHNILIKYGIKIENITKITIIIVFLFFLSEYFLKKEKKKKGKVM